jgi:hypothetical protein
VTADRTGVRGTCGGSFPAPRPHGAFLPPHRPSRRTLTAPLSASLTAALLLVGCDAGPSGGGEGDDATAGPGVDEDGELVCARPTLDLGATELVGDDAAVLSRRLADATDACATTVVVADGDDHVAAAIAAPLAASSDAPLLLDDGTADGTADGPDDGSTLDGTITALTREGDEPEVRQVGVGAAVEGDHHALALEVADDLGADTIVLVDADDPAGLTAAATATARTGGAVVPVTADDDIAAVLDDHEGRTVTTIGAVAERVPEDTGAGVIADPWATDEAGDRLWLVDPTDAAGSAVAVAAARRGDAVAPVDGDDLRTGRTEVQRVRDAAEAGSEPTLVGAIADPEQLPILLDAPQLPGGGLRHLEETRMVALYGRPGSPSLGVLGEQDLDATIARAREVAEGYDADGRDTVPTLEVIVTVASVDAQDDGSYSSVTAPAEFEELVARAGDEDVQVVLDLQPGRNDFLTQARIFEDLLREPHVGLALDPEWRLEDDQVHLEQIGGVEAAEVQAVVDWYAELTRDEGLAESLLVLHQFRLDMLPDRDTIEIPREITAVVHADGQGPQAEKLETWRVMTDGADEQWRWGWKNFYDEDPVVATPAEVLDLDPNVVFVTYQ